MSDYAITILPSLLPFLPLAHFLHVIAFAYILAAELPVYFAVRMALSGDQGNAVPSMIPRLVKWISALTGGALIVMLPLGIVMGVSMGWHDLAGPGWLTATWTVTVIWLLLLITAESITGQWGRRLFLVETVWRVIAGLGNVYDGVVGYMGTGQTRADWLAVKILIFGLLLVISAWVRWRMRPARYALLDSVSSGTPPTLSGSAGASLKIMGPVVVLTTILVAIAAWMGVNKPF